MDGLERAIATCLRETGQYAEDVPWDWPHASDRVATIRSTGRRVARANCWKVRTFATPLADGGTIVHVVLTETNSLHQQLLDRRRDELMRRAINDL